MSRINGIKTRECIVLIMAEEDVKKILLVKKADSWQLPGCAIEAGETNNIMALWHGMANDLPYVAYAIGNFFGEYLDTTIANSPIDVKVWHGEWKKGSILHGPEIDDANWVTAAEATSIDVLQVTRDVICDLQNEGLL